MTPRTISGAILTSAPLSSSPLGSGSDPNGVHATTVLNGTVTVIADSDITNFGPGNGIWAETDMGNIDVLIDQHSTTSNTGGDGVPATASGSTERCPGRPRPPAYQEHDR